MSRLVLGHFTKGEDKSNENKAFHLLPHTMVNIHDDDIFDLVDIGVWTKEFSLLVEHNILEYLSLILPKYITCWANARMNGELNLGVDDTNLITGVPCLGEINKEKLFEKIKDTIKENIQCDKPLEEIVKMIEVEFIDLDYDLEILSPESDDYMEKFSQDIREYNDKLDKYTIEHAEFLIKHRQYTQKLEIMLNTTKYRDELSQYIENDSECNEKIIELLKSNRYIRVKQENIHEDRENRGKVFYWIAKFRDQRSHEIKKPDRPLYPSMYHFRQILGNLPCMRHKFLSNNPNLKYYLIKIKCNVGGIKQNVKFRDRFSDRWLYRTRIAQVEVKLDRHCGPGCI